MLACSARGEFQWKGQGTQPTIVGIQAMICQSGFVDTWADDIWVAAVPKAALFLWRLQWERIPTSDHLEKRGMDIFRVNISQFF